jgi:hypothetical protein
MTRLLLMIRRWCDACLGVDPRMGRLPILETSFIDAAVAVVQDYESGPQSLKAGEYKRDRVYKTLHRQFPARPLTEISVAIEVACCRAR